MISGPRETPRPCNESLFARFRGLRRGAVRDRADRLEGVRVIAFSRLYAARLDNERKIPSFRGSENVENLFKGPENAARNRLKCAAVRCDKHNSRAEFLCARRRVFAFDNLNVDVAERNFLSDMLRKQYEDKLWMQKIVF